MNLDPCKILFICGHIPFPLHAGVHLRIKNIGKILQNFGNVTLVVISRPYKEPVDIDKTEVEFGNFFHCHTSEAPGRSLYCKVRRILDRKWIQGRGYAISQANREYLEELACKHDVVWIHTLGVADCIGIYHWPRSVIDLDDLTSVKYKLRVKVEKAWKAKIKGVLNSLLWRRWERDVFNRFSIVNVCSQEDKMLLRGNKRIHIIPNGFEVPNEKPVFKDRNRQFLGFIGTLRYYPNLDGLLWFVKEVLPIILLRFPKTRLRIVGLLPQDVSSLRHPNIDLLGFLDDYIPEMERWTASIVPLRIGGGTRIKILDAFSRLCPVVSTTLGAYGLGVENGRELLLADKAKEFSEACLKLMHQPKLAQSLVEKGWDSLTSRFDWSQQIKENIEQALLHCLSMK